MLFKKVFPAVNFLIATSALSFQVGVLYPWHEQLSKEMDEIKKIINIPK